MSLLKVLIDNFLFILKITSYRLKFDVFTHVVFQAADKYVVSDMEVQDKQPFV